MAFGSATAAKMRSLQSYSADDLALVQRDIGQLAIHERDGRFDGIAGTGITDFAVGAYASPNGAGSSVHAD